jgi:hypothetical protein
MGNRENTSWVDNAKAGLAQANTGVAVVAKKGAKAVAKGAGAVKAGAGNAKNQIDAKTRDSLDKAYAAKKPLAVANLKQLRKKHPSESPAQILERLNDALHKVEQESGSDAGILLDAISTYVLTSIEVYGTAVKGKPATKKLLDATLMMSSRFTKVVAKYGPAAAELVIAIVRKKGKTPSVKPTARKKSAVLGPLVRFAIAKIVGVENIGRKSATKIAETAVSKALGTPPAKWPAATTARKTVARK